MKTLTDTDLHLYLAKAMPWQKRLLFRVAVFFNDDLRKRLQEMRQEIAGFQSHEQSRLAYKLYANADLGRTAEARAKARMTFAERLSFHPRLRLALSTGLSLVIALAIWPLYQSKALKIDGPEEPLYTAKGSPLELSLFVKGDTLRRVVGETVRISGTDTLQLLPAGGAKPHIAIYGLEPGQPLTRLFPAQGEKARQITSHEPPPGLVLSGGSENRLICIALDKPFDLAEIENVLQGMAWGKVPSQSKSALLKNFPAPWHVQTFSVQGEP
jgi:hypothetical protein